MCPFCKLLDDLAVLARVRSALKASNAFGNDQDTAVPAAQEAAATQSPVPAGLNDPAIASIRETFAIVATAGDEAIGYFYPHDPQERPAPGPEVAAESTGDWHAAERGQHEPPDGPPAPDRHQAVSVAASRRDDDALPVGTVASGH